MGGVRAIPLSQLQAHIRETTLPAGAGARTMEDCSGKHPPSWERSPTELNANGPLARMRTSVDAMPWQPLFHLTPLRHVRQIFS